MRHLRVFLLFLPLISRVSCGNILYLHGMLSGSHHLWNRNFASALAKHGHNVTFLSIDKPIDTIENVHYVVLENVHENFLSAIEGMDLIKWSLETQKQSVLKNAREIINYCLPVASAIVNSKNGFEKILSYSSDFKFDLVVNDFSCGSVLLPLVHKFNFPPVIGVSAFNNPPYTTLSIGGHKYPAYVPHYFTDFPQIMSFWQRFVNHLVYWIEICMMKHKLYPEIDRMTRERYNFKDMLPLLELEKRTKLMLVNSDNVIDYPEPLASNLIQVGGLHINEPNELPPEMKTFVESGKKGTILMCLGTNFLSMLLSREVLTAILKTFESLPEYNFIWKFEADLNELPMKPSKNVMISKFVPQNDLLAHPHLKAFISHGGGLSTHESFYHGKPIVGVPFMVDQIRNVDNSVQKGVAVRVDILTLNVNKFRSAINTIMEDPKYAKKSREISKLYKDKPMKPLHLAVWWAEYVMRNPDAPFFKSPTLELGFLASNSLDIYLTLIVSFHVLIYGFVVLFRRIFRVINSEKLKKN